MSELDLGLSVALGIALAAATGLRLFLLMLVVSTAAYSGYLPLSENFAWLGTLPALILLAVAAAVEILAYYIPGLDNLLDTLATPAAFAAGTVISAAVITDVPPMIKWAAAIIAGQTADHWRPKFAAADCCVTIMASLEDALHDPHFVERGLFAHIVSAPSGVTMPALPMPIAATLRGKPDTKASPKLGADNDLLS